ncbi:hypothetical protein [Paenarthrobacter nicotinovorans]
MTGPLIDGRVRGGGLGAYAFTKNPSRGLRVGLNVSVITKAAAPASALA